MIRVVLVDDQTREDEAPPQGGSTSPASEALSTALRQRGWKFVGPTTVYAFMQAMGLFNDHAEGCVIREEAERREGH
jgi:DNA-3-methyladenine glycosylase I